MLNLSEPVIYNLSPFDIRAYTAIWRSALAS